MPKTPATTLVLNDGRKILIDVSHPTPADLVAFEDRFDVSADELGGENSRVKWSLFFMFRGASRQHPDIAEMGFEAFVENIESLIDDEVDERDPTGEVPTA